MWGPLLTWGRARREKFLALKSFYAGRWRDAGIACCNNEDFRVLRRAFKGFLPLSVVRVDGGMLGWQQPFQGTAFGLPAPTWLRVPAPVPSSGSPSVIWGRASVIFGFIFGAAHTARLRDEWRIWQLVLLNPGERENPRWIQLTDLLPFREPS